MTATNYETLHAGSGLPMSEVRAWERFNSGGPTVQQLYETELVTVLDDQIMVNVLTGELIESPECELAREAFTKALADDIDSKLDHFGEAIRTFESNARACAEEKERFAIRERILLNKAKRAKEWLQYAMVMANRSKVGTALTTAWIQPNGGKAPVDLHGNPDEVPDEFVRYERRVDIDKVRAALEGGAELSFARLQPRGSHLRLK